MVAQLKTVSASKMKQEILSNLDKLDLLIDNPSLQDILSINPWIIQLHKDFSQQIKEIEVIELSFHKLQKQKSPLYKELNFLKDKALAAIET